ncbi:hypothetical protein E2542_SST29484 [Spatholobus suberectus]|nr:hypothetical protein E2542_SST29484 [Spatholobus suberectus]
MVFEGNSGVCKVDINAEEQKAIVTGIINPSTLVQQLTKFGKHAEIWNAGYNDGQNNNQAQLINDPTASENEYVIPTFFDETHWGPKWCFHHFAAPLFLDNVNNRNKQNFTIINENPKWEESIIPMMRPASFHAKSGTNYSGLENQEWAHNFLGVSSTSEYGHQPSPMANIYGYYHEFHPSNMMQLSSYHHLP